LRDSDRLFRKIQKEAHWVITAPKLNHKNFVLERTYRRLLPPPDQTLQGWIARIRSRVQPLQFVTTLHAAIEYCLPTKTIAFRQQTTAALLGLLYHVFLVNSKFIYQIQATEDRLLPNREIITVRFPVQIALRSDYACDNSCSLATVQPDCNCSWKVFLK
jgi:hypothetical protein